jgi:hypothetical protein
MREGQGDPNWGGETVFFNRERAEIIASVIPSRTGSSFFAATIHTLRAGFRAPARR